MLNSNKNDHTIGELLELYNNSTQIANSNLFINSYKEDYNYSEDQNANEHTNNG